MARSRTTAVLLAGGTGQRVGLAIPKQLVKIAGKAVIEHTLAIFEQADSVDDVVVMMAPGYVAEVEKIVAKAGLAKVTKILEGGATRSETTERAIAALGEGLAEGRTSTSSSTTRSVRCSPSGSSRTVSTRWTATRPSTSPSPPRTRSL